MPVARNLSLPSSIEARKFKKRPEELHELKHCCSVPDDLRGNNNTNNDSDKDPRGSGVSVSRMTFHSSDAPTSKGETNVETSPSRSPVARNTLSQPCLSASAPVGMTSIFPHLFLGSQNDVADEKMMSEHRINNVLNVSCQCARPSNLDDRHFKRISVLDNYQEKITPHLDDAVRFIESARKDNERVLVHCLAGVSRSATVAIAYVMYYLRLGFDDAYRFVKEKRPTISPNFNFLGQLMEYEATLKQNGHLRNPRPQQTSEHKEPVLKAQSVHIPKIEVIPPRAPINHDQATSTKSTASTSSFCRRRNGPSLDKSAFKLGHFSTQGPHTSDCNGRNSHERVVYPSVGSQGGAGVILDLRVTTAAPESYSRRLGSDGREDERDEDLSPHQFGSAQSKESQKSNSLPRYRGGLESNHLYQMFTREQSKSKPTGERLRQRVIDTPRSFTAPNTPASLRLERVTDGIGSNDVEMQVDVISPPSPSSRYRSATDPINGPSFCVTSHELSSDFASPKSPLSEAFSSRKTRSPKVLKKSFLNLNVRPVYGYQAFLSKQQSTSNQSLHHHTRSRSQDLQQLPRSRSDTSVLAMSCASPSADGMSSLTLSSPVNVKDDPLKVVGNSCLPAVQNGSIPSANKPSSKGICTNGTGEPFQLVSSSELKPRWRTRHRSPKNDDAVNPPSVSGGSGSPSSASPAVLSHCNNVEMISCS